MTLDQLIEQCLEPRTRKYKGPSGQVWLSLHQDQHRITLIPEYPCSKHDSVTMPIEMFRKLGWKEID